jgi:hypothetical protein
MLGDSRGRWRLPLLAVLLSGCAANEMSAGMKSAVATAASTVGVSVHETPNRPDGFSIIQPGELPPAIKPLIAPPGTNPLVTRPYASLQRLYAKREVNGRELVDELVAMRKAMKERRSAMAVTQFMGSMQGGAANLASGRSNTNLGKLLGDGALRVVEALVAQQLQAIGYQALDDYLGFLVGDPKLLPAERITLPPAQGLNAQQLQRGATMAALVVATRVTAKVLKQAKEDFAGLEVEYGGLIQRREEAAKLLYTVLAEKRGATLEKDFDGPDLAYLHDNVQRMSLQQFANDLGAQNLALRHLQRSDPKAYASYKAQADGLSGRTKGVLRTSAGVLAFGAMLVNFTQSVSAVAKDKQAAEIIGLMPMALDFISSAPPIIQHAIDAGAKGAEVLVNSDKRFRLVDAEGKVVEYAAAKQVFEQLAKQGDARQLLDESLFRDGSPGLIYRLYRCDRAEAGRLLDTAVPAGERDRFASTYLSPEESRFSFANVFETPKKGSVREEELGDELLRRDHRRSTDERTRSFSALQASTTKGYTQWSDEQLLGLIFANREGQAAHATLQLGDVRLRPVPNMQSVYVYESLVDGCREAVGGPKLIKGGQKAAPPAPRKGPPATPPGQAKKGNAA